MSYVRLVRALKHVVTCPGRLFSHSKTSCSYFSGQFSTPTFGKASYSIMKLWAAKTSTQQHSHTHTHTSIYKCSICCCIKLFQCGRVCCPHTSGELPSVLLVAASAQLEQQLLVISWGVTLWTAATSRDRSATDTFKTYKRSSAEMSKACMCLQPDNKTGLWDSVQVLEFHFSLLKLISDALKQSWLLNSFKVISCQFFFTLN